MSQQELAELVGFKTASAVNKIELGLRDINQSRVKAFAKALNTTTSFLLDGETKTSTSKAVKIPVLGFVRAGYPMGAVENILDYEEISEEMARSGEFFALKIQGDAWNRELKRAMLLLSASKAPLRTAKSPLSSLMVTMLP